jgi:Flagellar basal body rod FlgEFG protein C-terminal
MTIDFVSGAANVARATESTSATLAPLAEGGCLFGDLLEAAAHGVAPNPPNPLPVFPDGGTQPSMDGKDQAKTATANGPLAPAPPVAGDSPGAPNPTAQLPAGGGQLSPGSGSTGGQPTAPELTKMILAQRGYQADVKTITTSAELLMDTLILKR